MIANMSVMATRATRAKLVVSVIDKLVGEQTNIFAAFPIACESNQSTEIP